MCVCLYCIACLCILNYQNIVNVSFNETRSARQVPNRCKIVCVCVKIFKRSIALCFLEKKECSLQ